MLGSPYEEALAAIRGEDPDLLRELLTAHPDLVRQRDPDHRDYTLLLHAGHAFESEVARVLIAAGADVHTTSRDGATAFSNAIARCERDVAAVFVEAGYVPRNLREAAGWGHPPQVRTFFAADGSLRPEAGSHRELNPHNGWIDAELSDDPTAIVEEALTFAARNGQTEVARFLIEHGAAGKVTDALFLACLADHLDTAKMLVEHGADVNHREEEGGSTPVDWAVSWDAKEVSAWLMGEAPLDMLLAVEHGATSRVRQLLTQDPALARTPDADGDTPLHAAAWANRLEIADLLLDAGADPLHPNDDGTTPLGAAVNLLRTEIVARFAARGAPLDLLGAVVAGDLDTVRARVDAGDDLAAPTPAGHSSLAIAVGCGRPEIAALLEAAGAPILGAPSDTPGLSPLHLAVRDDRPADVARLLAAEVDPNAATGMGRTALFLLHDGIADLPAMVALFTDARADLEHADTFGNTPRDWIEKQGHPAASRALAAAGARKFSELPLREGAPH